jgi:predicted Fe-Mo cluster-binding NifX family protein
MLTNEKPKFSGKIAVATNDQKRVTGHIGRCRGFMVFEINDQKIINKELRENQFTNHRRGGGHHHHGEGEEHRGQGHGRHGHERLVEGLKDCKYLISSGGGWRVVEDLKEHNIETLFTDVKSIDDAIEKFIKGELVINMDLTCNHNEH